IEHPDNEIPEAYFVYWSYLLLPCNKGEKMNSFDDLGDHDNYIDYYGEEPGDSIRIMYGFDGDDPDIPDDDRGDPFPERYLDDARYNKRDIYDVGEFLSAMYAGYGVLHVDSSPTDRSNDLSQPFTSGWTSVNEILTWENEAAWGSMLNQGEPFHTPAPDLTSPPERYRQSFWMGFGPFRMAPGDSVTLVFVHAAKGPEISVCKDMGLKWFNKEISVEERNEFLDSGRDSLFKAVGRAQYNWNNYLSNGMSIPMGPSQPQNVVYESGGNSVNLSWVPPDVGDVDSYRIYRQIGNYVGDYDLIAEVPATETSYEDLNVAVGISYYYYVTAVNEDGIESTAHYNRRNAPARPFKKHSEDISKVRVVPNPFNYHQANRWAGERNRITFTNLTNNCTIRVFTVNGDLVKTFEHKSDSATEHWSPLLTEDNIFPAPGVYVYVVKDNNTGKKETGKFIIVR
ncbi:T9SS type A sorting domain-containing protein, partial [candidate division KSB1 bacterium]|nr:T9SS type A sorting domain-containing protein [candidate division KSB1 bacterium]